MSEVLKRRMRCAVYTRKSTDEGLDQEYNSLEAQRDAGLAFVSSQRHEGWVKLAKVYEEALCHELRLRGIPFRRQVLVPVLYKGAELKAPCKCDLWVAGMIIVENKAASALTPIDDAQLLGYLKLMDQRLGLLMNFNVKFLKQGVRRIVNGSLE